MQSNDVGTLNYRGTRRVPAAGFSLIELMVTVLVISILAAIAIPTYTSSVRKSRRTEAKVALLDLAGREERYYNTNNSKYSSTGSDLGYPAFPTTVGNGYYSIAAPTVTAGTSTQLATFSITATPVAGTSQANDTACTSFIIDSTGKQSSTPAGSTCW